MIDPINELKKLQAGRSLRALARQLDGISAGYLSDIMKGNKPPSDRVLELLGLRKSYERINGNGRDSSPSAKRSVNRRAPGA